MKSSKKSLKSKFGKKYDVGGTNNIGAEFKAPAPFGNYTTPIQPEGTITTQDYSFAPGVFSDKQAQSTFTPMMSPMNIYDVDPNTSGIQQGPLTQDQVSERGAQGQELPTTNNQTNKPIDYNSMFTLGLGLTSMGLNQREEQRNRRLLNESIQQRQSQPLYDYNYMYGRTTSGGTEFQPIVKAEMGAQINKRYDSPSSINNVEIEGGEYLQLPDMSTEMAYGPSHSRGGIETSLPEGTRVYSNHLKPMGSKKTFAQMAKKYDNSDYDKILNNKFAKQVDKDTAAIMRDKNQKVLDKLFMDQQMMNGNSNGEPMAKNGASINNAGFRALPKAVQDQIISNMEYGGYSLPKLQGGDWYSEDDWNSSQSQNVMRVPDVMGNTNTTPRLPMGQPLFPAMQVPDVVGNTNTTPQLPMSGPELVINNNRPVQTAQPKKESKKESKSEPTLGDMMMAAGRSMTSTPTEQQMKENIPYALGLYTSSKTPEGGVSPTGKSVYASTDSPEEYVAPWLDLIPNALDMTESQFQSSVYDYALKNDPESISNMWKEYGLTTKGKKDKELMSLTKDGKFDPKDLTPENLEKLKKAYVDGKLGARTLKPTKSGTTPDASGTPDDASAETQKETKTTTNVNTPGFTSVTGQGSGKYYRQPFPLEQAIPNVMGLAASQETFPYAIPEIDSPYIRPQTLNIQSQLQDIDNMGQASVRAGADPLSAYIAGIGGKERAFQSKQNFDAQGRMQADTMNAQAQQRADMMNAQLFDRTYNNLIAQARDAATAEQQAAISNLVQKKAKYDQDENLKSLYLDNLQSAFEIGKDRPYSMTVDPQGRPTFSYGVLPAQVDMPTKGRTTKTKKDETKTTDVVPSEKITTTRRTR
jgi:hypothetical protein